MSRKERVEKQLADWVGGNSVHNTVDDECCPDFSCCNRQVKTNIETRQKFFEADEREREKMLVGFLANAFETLGVEAEVSSR